MNIKVEFYGQLKSQFKEAAITIVINESSTIDAVMDQLCLSYQTEVNKKIIKPILNDTFAQWTDVISANDVVGFFPPAAGG